MKINDNIKKDKAIVYVSKKGEQLAHIIKKEIGGDIESFAGEDADGVALKCLENYSAIIFIGALGICVRWLAPFIKNKYSDPAVICIDSTGKYVIPLLSGHLGGSNELALEIAPIIGAEAIITTQSDNSGMWALDLLGKKFDWQTFTNRDSLNKIIACYVNGGKTALLLDIRSSATEYLETHKSSNVDVFYNFKDIETEKYELIIAVSPYLYSAPILILTYVPKVLHLGIGCRKDAIANGTVEYIYEYLTNNGINPAALASVSTIDIKEHETLVKSVAERVGKLNIYTANQLIGIEVANPSNKVMEVCGVYGVAETCALKSASSTTIKNLIVQKQRSNNNKFTFAIAIEDKYLNNRAKGRVEIVGAGPGDPELISIRGKRMIEKADLVLYAGSLVPKELTYYAKKGAIVRSSASMDLNEQFTLMKEFTDKGLFVVRLHTGDPCIYGAIAEQMAFFDKHKIDYHITPGISSFLAAAAELKSQFTIPEEVQTIILTRGEGRTLMPEKEKLSLLAQSQSTMCIFLSASIAEEIEKELLAHYPPNTPVAACYHLTWKDQKIFRGELKDLSKIIKTNNLSLTTMIVVGKAIDNRQGLSRLYAPEFKHLFR